MSRRAGTLRAAAILTGFAADVVWGDPQRGHPVAGYGQLAGRAERRWWRDSRGAGVAYAGLCVGAPVLVAAAIGRRSRPVPGALVLAAAVWACVGGTSLGREAQWLDEELAAGDLGAARRRLGSLCAREARGLDAAELARATVESVAENTSDAAVAPLLWAAVAGLPGVIGYRAANTLDAMVGYRSPRYANFGRAAARFDDLVNLVPARVTAALAVAAAPAVGGSPLTSWRVLRRDGGGHPSPNAGRCEAAFAGALGVRLGGTNSYDGDHETRGTLGDGPAARPVDIARAVRLSRVVTAGAALLAVAVAMAPADRAR